jgi:hypothetical protein
LYGIWLPVTIRCNIEKFKSPVDYIFIISPINNVIRYRRGHGMPCPICVIQVDVVMPVVIVRNVDPRLCGEDSVGLGKIEFLKARTKCVKFKVYEIPF